MHAGDGELLTAARGGDVEAVKVLLERHGPAVWADVQRDIGVRWQAALDADDVMQVTYVEAFLEIGRLTATEPAGFVAWLRQIARNNLRDAIKELERKKRPPPAMQLGTGTESDSYVALVEMLGATSQTPSRHVAAAEAGRMIHALLDRLPPDYGQVVRMYDLEGRDVTEVAGALQRSPGAIHMLRARAHDRLRALLGSESQFFSKPA